MLYFLRPKTSFFSDKKILLGAKTRCVAWHKLFIDHGQIILKAI